MKMISRTIIVTLLLFGCFPSTWLQAQNLIPTPKEVVLKERFFSFDEELSLKADEVSGNEVEFLKDVLKGNITISDRKESSAVIHLNKIASSAILKEKLIAHKLNGDYQLGSEGYLLIVSETSIEIIAAADIGIFYGIQTLRQLLTEYRQEKKIPCMVIYDKPDIAIRAWQDDVSRGPIPTLETLKQEIEIMSSFKLNHFTLYTEHIFRLEKHPTIAPKEGITKADLTELSDFAKKHHVTLIGNYQSFGHMNKTLSNPKYTYLAESADIISPAMEESYDFLSDVYEEIVPQYDGAFFNINCDETFGLGKGKSRAMADSMGVEGIYSYHINRLDALLKKYDKKILMWGDVATTYPEIIPALPKDMTVMAWGYSAEDNFDHAIEPIVAHDLDFWVAPGISCWSNVYPDLKTTETNVYNFIRDGYRFNAKGVLNTSWDDDALNFFNNNWHGFIWGAELSWSVPADLPKAESDKEKAKRYQKFNTAFDKQFYGLPGDESITALMNEFSSLHHVAGQNILKNEGLFEGIFPMYTNYIKPGSKEQNESVLNQLDTLLASIKDLQQDATAHQETIDYLLYSVGQAKMIVQKNLFRIDLHAYLYQEAVSTEEELVSSQARLVNDLNGLKSEYIALWNRENRAHWLPENLEKFDALIKSTESLGSRVLIEPINEQGTGQTSITMRTVFDEYPIQYATAPDSLSGNSTPYTKPFYLKEAGVIQARAYDQGKTENAPVSDFLYHKAVGRLHRLISTPSSYHPSYYAGGKKGLVDGKLGFKEDLWSGQWQGYQGQDIELELAFQPDDPLQSFSMGFFQHTAIWVIFPPQVDIYVKNNASDDYKLYRTIKGTISPKEKGALKQNYTTDLGGLKTKYMKVVAKYYGRLPEWHKAGSQYESMIFADEIIIK